MEYPIMADGRKIGTLKVYRQGLYTVYAAHAEARKELFRLSVYGQGREGRLGLMQPRDSGLFLERRLSNEAQKGFPRRIEYAAPSGEKSAAENCDKGGLLWYRHKNGTLSAFDGKRQLVAIPVRCGLGFGTRCIEGREYAVFFY